MAASPSVVEHSRLINASAQEIFDLLADPMRHAEIDGSGSVQGVVDGRSPARLSLGATFGMKMRMGAPYTIRNEVVEFEEPTRIAWRHGGHHVWRYLLEPVDENSTTVTEQFDSTQSRAPFVLKLMKAHRRNSRSIEQTLDRLAARYA